MKRLNVITLSLASLLLSPFLMADSQTNLQNLPEIIKIASEQQGWTPINHFKADSGLDGWIIDTQRGYHVAYTDSKGFLLIGEMISPDGVMLNDSYLAKYSPKRDYDSIIAKTVSIKLGGELKAGEKPVVIFYEPYCGYCSAIYAAIQPYVATGKQVLIVPVAFLSDGTKGKPSSEDVISSLLAADNPASALASHESHTLGANFVKAAPEGFREISESQLTLMHSAGAMGTPAVLYPDANGEYSLIAQVPTMEKLAEIFNAMRQDSDDPRLLSFGAEPNKYPVIGKLSQ